MTYEEIGIDKYVFVATLDNRTSEICQSLDHEFYEYSNMEVGVNNDGSLVRKKLKKFLKKPKKPKEM